jgi:hypothetical protein
MSKTIDIRITTAADLKGVQAAQKALADLTKASSKSSGNGAAAAYTAQSKAANTAAAAAAKLAIADSRVAAAAANASAATQRNATATANAAAAHARAEKAVLSFATAQARAEQATARANSGMAVLPRTIAGLSHEAAAFATASLTMGAAVGVATAAVSSFADAFQFKAQLDATTLAVNAQLKGMRDSGQVWNEAAAFAQKFKLTQEETTNAISASIGVMRASKAPVEDILGVLARMQVLSPEQSLQEAAIALKALASGDTTSLVTRFEVGRDVANQMKQEIQGGADAVQVMSKFLEGTGIGMDVLTAKTQGAAGALKDLAKAQEDLKLAQAEFAQGPGLAILQGQIKVTQDATKALGGDFQALNAIINDSGVGAINPLIGALASYNDAVLGAGKSALEWIGALDASSAAAQASAAGLAAFDAEMAISGDTTQAEIAYQAAYATALQTTAAATAQNTARTKDDIVTTSAAALALAASSAALVEETQRKFESAAEAERLAKFQEMLAQLGGAVANGMATAGNAAARLAQMYGIATSEALKLIQAQAALAQAKVNAAALSDQRAGERDAGSARTAAQITFAADQDRKAHASRIRRAEEAEAALKRLGTAGGNARVSAAGAAATKLETLEQKTGDKIAEIVASTQEKVTAITEREAAKQAQALQKLNESIATAAADRRASSESDDLDLIGVDDPKAAARLNDRERAQAAAREREKQAAAEARATAEAGDAELAQKQYDIREKQIGDQQSLDEKYYDRQRELASDPATQAALKQQYDEATRANEEAAATRIGLAQAEAAQKKQAVADETAAVIAAANEQANQVVSAAERSATGVKNASAAARTTAVSNLKAIGDAVNAIPSSKTITISVKQDGSVGASATPAGRAKGGDTNVGRVTLVGERGPELVVFDTPGRVYSADKTKAMFQAGRIPGLATGGTIDAGGGYTTPIAGTTPTSGGKGKKKKGYGKISTAAPIDPKKALDEMRNTVQLLMDMAKLKEQIADLVNVPAFDIPTVQALVNRAQEFTAYVSKHLIVVTKDEGESLERYFKAAQGAIGVIGDMASLKKDIAELKDVPAFDQPTVLALIDRAQQFTTALQQHLIPLTEYETDLFSRYASAVGDSVGILKDMSDLKKELATVQPPLDTRYINQLVADAAVVTVIMRQHLIATTEEQAKQVGLYADAVGSTASALKDVASIGGKLFADYTSPSDAQLRLLTTDADRITGAFATAAAAYKKDGLEQAKSYADAVGATFGTVKDGLLAVDALNSGDFVLKSGTLEKFATASMDILDTTERLGARASQIPAGDMAALQTATSAISGQAEALIRLNAVPFGDLGGAASGLAQSGGAMGGGSTTTIMPGAIVVNAQPGMDVRAIGQEVMRQINSQVATRR